MAVENKETKARVSKRTVTLEKDEGNRPDTTLEGLAKLKPVRGDGQFITAGNASQLSDGASACVLMSRQGGGQAQGSSRSASSAASRSPAASPTRWASARCSPCRGCLQRTGLKIDDIDLWELNEAFAVQVHLLPRPARHPAGQAQRRRRRRSPSAIPTA